MARAAAECARLKVHSDTQLDVCTGLLNAFHHLLEVVNAYADKDPKLREEAAVFFKSSSAWRTRVARAVDGEVHACTLSRSSTRTLGSSTLLEVVNADADKSPRMREEAAAFFKRMEDDKRHLRSGVCGASCRRLGVRAAEGALRHAARRVHRAPQRVLSALLRASPFTVRAKVEKKNIP